MAGITRKVNHWLQAYLEYTAEQESPKAFHTWVGLSVIASTLERRVWLNRGYYDLFPNLYVVLVGASAKVRKTTAVNTGYNLLREALPDITIVSQKMTPEALINVFVQESREREMSGGTIVSTELGVFLGSGTRATDLMQLLTDWYDCPKRFVYHTLARGKEPMENVYCNLIGCTTPEWLKDAMPPSAIGGGFTSRIVFVYGEEPQKLIAFPFVTQKMLEQKRKLMYDLEAIKDMDGQFYLTEDAQGMFSKWYQEHSLNEHSEHKALDGYMGRKHDTLLRVGMCVAACKRNDLFIDTPDLEESLMLMMEVEKTLPTTLRLIQMTPVGVDFERVFRIIARKGRCKRSDLMRSVSYCMNAKRLDEVINDLTVADRIESFTNKGTTFYKVKGGVE